jgi:hypothetical protein
MANEICNIVKTRTFCKHTEQNWLKKLKKGLFTIEGHKNLTIEGFSDLTHLFLNDAKDSCMNMRSGVKEPRISIM